jgi:hypothetical protein
MTANNRLYNWINDNNPPLYVELLQKVAAELDADEVRVIATCVVDTPPPQEKLTMPAVVIDLPRLRRLLAHEP